MIKIRKIQNTCIRFLMILAISGKAFAGNESFTNRIQGAMIADGAKFIVTDDKFYPVMYQNPGWTSQFRHKGEAVNKVTLGIDHDCSTYYSQAFSVTAQLLISYKDKNSVTHQVSKTLTIDYQPGGGVVSSDKDIYLFYGAHEITVEIVSITCPQYSPIPENVFLQADVAVERYYTFDHTGVPTVYSTAIQGDRILNVYWGFVPGAEEYDLEWTFVNDYDGGGSYISPTSLEYGFDFNKTRVTTVNTNYQIPIVNEHGYLLYRIRGVGRSWVGFTQRVEGRWSSYNYTGNKVSDFPDRYAVTAHHNDSLNWAFNAVYLDGGKSIAGVDYFDGTMRNRQKVGKNNAIDKAMVQETFYDHQGRPALFTLAAPAEQGTFRYYSGFNKNSSDVPYAAADFDLDVVSCQAATDFMSTTSGASRYYSSDNPDKDFQQAYLPDAEGFPFYRVEYTPDQTGRIRRQGGVGKAHQLNTGHETKMFYSKPLQNKLNKLFGTDAGYSSHYFKTITRDPNGQLSISYLDLDGKVIATSLAGDVAAGLEDLPSNTGHVRDTVDLLDNNEKKNGSDYAAIVALQTFDVVSAGTHKFDYNVTPKAFTDTCLPANICYDCVYNLVISLKDECGVEKIPDGPYVQTIGQLPLDTMCQDTTYTYVISQDTFAVYLEVGVYTLTKQLIVDEEAVEYYTEKYIEQNECLLTYDDFLQTIMDSVDITGCDISYCEWEVITEHGTREEYISGGGTSQEYDAFIQECEAIKKCDTYRKAMEADLSPGGQYGLFMNTTTLSIDPSIYPLSIFNENNQLPNANASWRNPVTPYLDENGDADSVVLANGTKVPPGDISVTIDTFIMQWKPSWAASLLPYHPEYCYLGWCTSNEASHLYDYYMLTTQSYQAALDSGYLNPLNMYHYQGLPSPVPSNPLNIDPFFDTFGYGSSLMNAMKDSLENFYTDDIFTFNIWQMALVSVYCPDFANYADVQACLTSIPAFGNDTCKNDMVWQRFRDLYMDRKAAAFNDMMKDYVTIAGCYNGDTWQSSLYDDKVKCFPDPDEEEPWGTGDPFAYMDSLVHAEMLADCEASCEAQADGWMYLIHGCVDEQEDSALYHNIRNELIAVCKLGCDSFHPNGASTAPVGLTTTLGNSSFEGVLAYYLGTGYENDTCNHLLISEPPPYTFNSFDSYKELDSCACNKLLTVNKEFYEGSLPQGVTTKEELFAYMYGEYIPDLDDAICNCSSAFGPSPPWTPGATWTLSQLQNLSGSGILVPSTVTCRTCIGCDTFALYKSQFEQAYPYAVGSDDYYRLLANYLNSQLNYHLSQYEYMDFDSACLGGSQLCSVLTDEAYALHTLFNDLLQQGELLPTSYVDDLRTYSTYGGTVLEPYYTPAPGAGYYHYYWACDEKCGDVCSDTKKVLHIGYYDNCDGCEITLEIPDCYDCGLESILKFDNIISFDDIEITDEPQTCLTKYNFKLITSFYDEETKTGGTWQVLGTSTCYPITQCPCDTVELCDNPASIAPDTNSCVQHLIRIAENDARNAYNAYIESIKEQFRNAYRAKCQRAIENELFTMAYDDYEYHYTLYYYDQAGNLVKTIPPEGVKPLSDISQVDAARNNSTTLVPNHTLATQYRYDANGQVIEQYSPDGDTTRYWYDKAGRVRFSQNAQQQADGLYSYTKYDIYGRMIEAGESSDLVAAVFPFEDPAAIEDMTVPDNNNTQITRVFYDQTLSATINALFESGQQNLRLRVATVAYYESDPLTDEDYAYATHYSYDVNGVAKEVIHQMPELQSLGQEIKRITYDYETISRNVKTVYYQKGQPDQLIHKYEYDADNRLTNVYTSRDSANWTQDAEYLYYHHGPLARTELGNEKVQGIDYYYTLQGWIKGANITDIDPETDPGTDGKNDPNNLHKWIPSDIFAYTLGYYKDGMYNDYIPISGANMGAATNAWATMNPSALYNGNIAYAIYDNQYFSTKILASTYHYDQLNRLKSAHTHNYAGGSFSRPYDNMQYDSYYWYDANGNIDSLIRFDQNRNTMDMLGYRYNRDGNNNLVNNRLQYVDEYAGTTTNPADLEDQQAGNYQYSLIGNLAKDQKEEIDTILWTVYGKVKEIQRTQGSTKPWLEFKYDAMGNRIAKIVKPAAYLTNPDKWETTYYIRDAQSNILSTYTKKPDQPNDFYLDEQMLYGSDMLGTISIDAKISDLTVTNGIYNVDLGRKRYELSNHLGNVLAVVSDRRIPMPSGAIVSYYRADIRSAQEYYPFGSILPGRSYNSTDYRFGFNSKEKDDEWMGVTGTTYDYGFRIYDSRVARFLSIDPLFRVYPYYSSYQFAGNSPIAFIDLDGLERVLAITFNSDVNYRADRLETMNSGEISKKVLTNDPAGQLVEAFKQASDADPNGIGFVAIWGHGTSNALWGTQSDNLFKDDLDQLEKAIEDGEIKFTENAIIYIGNCNAGTNDENDESFAQKLADITKAKVIAGSTDDRGSHRGSVGVEDESNGNLKYTMWYPDKDNFRLFENGKAPRDLGGKIDIRMYLDKGASLPIKRMSPKRAILPTVKTSEARKNIRGSSKSSSSGKGRPSPRNPRFL